MILWHKRLIVFSIKVAGVILLIVAFAFFLFYNYFFKKDIFLKYVPPSAAIYITAKINNGIKDNQLVYNAITQYDPEFLKYDLNQLNHLVNYNSAFVLIPSLDNEFAFDYLVILNFSSRPTNSANELLFINKYDLNSFWLTNQTLSENLLFLSNSQAVINQVKNITAYKEDSFAKNLSVAMGLSKIKLNNTAKIYIDWKQLASKINYIQDLPIKMAITSIFASHKDQSFFKLKLDTNTLIVENLDDLDSEIKSENLLNQVPKDTIFSLSFTNGANSWFRVNDLLKAMDLNTYLAMEKNLAAWQNIFQFNLHSDILPLFSDLAMLIATDKQKYIIAVKTDDNDLTKIKNTIQLYLATVNPDIKEKNLPDYTSITQIIRQPEKYQFKTEVISGIPLHFVSDTAEFGYFYRDNLLILANSIQKLRDLINNNNLASVDSVSSCKLPNQEFADNAYIGSQFLANYKQYFNNLNIATSSAESGKIWLCLE